MPKAAKIYSRLTRNASGVGSYSSLWLADDHLLIIRSTGYSEEYSRVQLRDVKAFVIKESDRHVVWSVLWGLFSLVPAIILVSTLFKHEKPIFSGLFLALTTTLLIWNLVLGPACVASMVTNVQTAQLKPLNRMRKARKVIARLSPLIVAAQSDLKAASALNALDPPLSA